MYKNHNDGATLKALKNMKNDTTLVRMRIGDHFGDANMSKKGT